MDENNIMIYDGNEPYIFISYAHKDCDRVLPIIKAMQKNGFRVWMDLGIEVGTEWSNNIAAHLRDCAVFVAFISHSSVASENCLDEIAYAKSNKKDSLMIFLEEGVELPEGTEMQTARFQRMYLPRQGSFETMMESINTAAIFEPCRGTAASPEAPVERKVTAPAPKAEAKSSRKKTLILAAAAAVVVVGVVLAAVFMLPGGKKDPDGKDAVVTMSDSLLDFTFELQGTVYQLPFDFPKLTESGWTITSSNYSSETPVAGRETAPFTMAKDGKHIYVEVFNESGNALPISQCTVGSVQIERDAGVDFKLAKEITVNATLDEILEAFGTPTSRSNGTDYERLVYGDEYGEEQVVFYVYTTPDMVDYSSIELSCFRESGNVTTETSEEVPAYLADYQAPAALGTDLTVGIIQVDGDLYQLPAPVQTFLDNGWTISSGVGFVPSGGDETLTLSRNNLSLDVTVTNFAEYQTVPANCAVIGVSEYNENGCITLPGNIKLGMAKADLESVVGTLMEVYESSYSTSYSYYSDYKEDRDYYLSISVETETGTVTSINVKERTWIY